MRTPKTASELAAALRTMFAARVPHLVMAGQGPAWSIVGNADRLYDLQAAAQALDDLASAYNAQLQALQFLPDGTVRPVFCGADCVDEGLCRDTQSCDRVGAESVGRVNLAPARPASADRSDVGNAWAVLASHGYPDDGKTRLDDMILRAITGAPAAPVAQESSWLIAADLAENSAAIREALEAFAADQTGDNAAGIVAAVLDTAPQCAAPSAPVARHVGDTKFEGWLSCHEPDRSHNRTPRYSKQDMRAAYWAGYSEAPAAPAAPGARPEPSDGWASAYTALEKDRNELAGRVRFLEDHAKGDVWFWQGDGEDRPESLASSLPVVIRADQLRELIAAAPAAPVAQPVELQRVKEAIANGGGFWAPCTGCHEYHEGYATGVFSHVFGCHLGNGCSECGGIGAIWDTTDYDAMARAMMSADSAPQPDAAAPVPQPVSAAEEFDAPASCPAREAMGVHACQDRAQCWEPCGALGQSAAHVVVSKDYAPAPGVESEGGEG